jgi:hypothetical protein
MKSRFLFLLIALTPIRAFSFIYIRASEFLKGERPVSQAPIWANRTVSFHINTNQNPNSGSISPDINAAV